MADIPLDASQRGGELDTRDDAGKGNAGRVKLWTRAIELAAKDQEEWRKAADDAGRVYRGEGRDGARANSFNILFSNTETLRTAVYNSEPVPDVRRRFSDSDEAGKVAGQVVERSLVYFADQPSFGCEMRAAVKDCVLYGRGITRVRYWPTVDQDTGAVHSSVGIEHVQWRDFLHGPGRRWMDVQWVAFRHMLTRDQVTQLNARIGASIPLDYRSDGTSLREGRDDEAPSDIFKRLLVWEIWDKEQREVLFIAPSHDAAPLRIEPDPLKLTDFYPIPTPLMAIERTDSLVPIEPYRLYRPLAEHLDTLTERARKLTEVIKWRGLRAVTENDTAFALLRDAEDGELVPAESALLFAQAGGIDKSIWLMPIEQAVATLRELYEAIERVKQTIYEVTGIADILRGATNANETATAQQIKAQWGALRVSDMQAAVANHGRQLFRIMAEIICLRMEWPELATLTQTRLLSAGEKQQAQAAQQAGMQVSPQIVGLLERPSVEDVEQILRSDTMRCYRIDIETDSTVRADVTRQQNNVAQFVTGFGQFVQAVGPAVQAQVMPLDVATDLLTGFARVFKLGRQAEDALDRLGQQAQQRAALPQQQQPAADAENAALEQAKLRAQMEEGRARLALDTRKVDADIQFRDREAALRERELVGKEAAMQQEFQLRAQDQWARAATETAKLEDGRETRSLQRADAEQQRRDAGMAPNTYEDDMKEVAVALEKLAQALVAMAQAQQVQHAEIMAALSAPKQVVRGKSGRVEGVRTVLN